MELRIRKLIRLTHLRFLYFFFIEVVRVMARGRIFRLLEKRLKGMISFQLLP